MQDGYSKIRAQEIQDELKKAKLEQEKKEDENKSNADDKTNKEEEASVSKVSGSKAVSNAAQKKSNLDRTPMMKIKDDLIGAAEKGRIYVNHPQGE